MVSKRVRTRPRPNPFFHAPAIRSYRRPRALAATPVDELPQKGSSTRAPGRLAAYRIRSSRYSGFWVGCRPCRFSPGGVRGPVHTSFICLPPLRSFISS